MSLSDLASLGSFVSGIAVLVSLIYLALQVRQAERNQKAAIMQGRANQAVGINATGADPSIAEALTRGLRGEENITETTLRQFHQYWRASFFIWQDSFNQRAAGVSTDITFDEDNAIIRHWLGNIGVRTQWRLQRKAFGPAFVARMDKLVTETPIDKSSDTVVLWRDALTAERSGAPY